MINSKSPEFVNICFVVQTDRVVIRIFLEKDGVVKTIDYWVPNGYDLSTRYDKLKNPTILNYVLWAYAEELRDTVRLFSELNKIKIQFNRNIATLTDGPNTLIMKCTTTGFDYELKTSFQCLESYPD